MVPCKIEKKKIEITTQSVKFYIHIIKKKSCHLETFILSKCICDIFGIQKS